MVYRAIFPNCMVYRANFPNPNGTGCNKKQQKKSLVGEEDKAIPCDVCERWQHLTCETGISLRQYRKMMKGNVVVTWKCCECSRMIVDIPIDFTPEVPEIVEFPIDADVLILYAFTIDMVNVNVLKCFM